MPGSPTAAKRIQQRAAAIPVVSEPEPKPKRTRTATKKVAAASAPAKPRKTVTKAAVAVAEPPEKPPTLADLVEALRAVQGVPLTPQNYTAMADTIAKLSALNRTILKFEDTAADLGGSVEELHYGFRAFSEIPGAATGDPYIEVNEAWKDVQQYHAEKVVTAYAHLLTAFANLVGEQTATPPA